MSKPSKIFLAVLALSIFVVILTDTQSVNGKTFPSSLRGNTNQWVQVLGQHLVIRDKVDLPGSNGQVIPSGMGGTTTSPTISPSPSPSPVVEETPRVKGVYLTAWSAGNPVIFRNVLNFIDKTEVNSVVIDVKDDTGTISYPSLVPLTRQIGAGENKFDPVKVIDALKQRHIYPIARIVTFKDPFLARKVPDLAVRSSRGGIWHDYQGLSWVDPYNKRVWEYTVAIAKEAVKMGFREIQFDYVRFTSDGLIRYCVYPGYDKRVKADVIRDFLAYAYQELHPLGVKIAADVFGLTCSAMDDLGIGQVFEKIVSNVDVICPMVYPSHYGAYSYGLPDPDAKPYNTVYSSMMDAQKKLAVMKQPAKIIIRPWLQDFTLRNHYGRAQLLAQIKAVTDAGLQEWIFWNPGNSYDIAKYRLKSEVKNEPTLTPMPSNTPVAVSSPTPSLAKTVSPSSTMGTTAP